MPGSKAAGWLRATRPARRHWAFAALLVAGLALRVITQFAYRPALLYIDTGKYIIASWQQYDPEAYRYLMLLPVTWVGNLAVVAALQHILGMAMAAAGYVTLIRRGVPRWGATAATAPVLLDGYQLQAEQTIMPDVLFQATIVAGLVVLLWKPRPGLRGLIAAGALLGLSAEVRQIGEALIAPLLVFAVVAADGWRRLRNGSLVAASFALPVLAYMTFSATVLHDGFRLSDQGDAVLYGRTAQAADCASLHIPGYERPLCPSPKTAATLGVDGLVNDPRAPVHRYTPPRGVDEMAAIKGFSYSVIEQQPLRIAGAIARDAVKVFAVTRHTDTGDTPIVRWQFQTRYPSYPPGLTRQIESELIHRTGGGGRPRADRSLAAFLRAYQLHGGYTPGPYLLLALLAGVCGAAAYRRGRDSTLALSALLVSGAAVAVVLGADVYEFSWRYQLPALVTLPTAGALGAAALAARVKSARAARKGRHVAERAPVRGGPGGRRRRGATLRPDGVLRSLQGSEYR